jgi:DNA-directed RNA polymerase alpha subunit
LNAIRHALFQQPSLSIIDCTIFANDTGISDQVLSHALTLVPLYLDPSVKLTHHNAQRTTTDTSENTIVFVVTVDAPVLDPVPLTDATRHTPDPDAYVPVYARDLRFHPVGDQVLWTSSASSSGVGGASTPTPTLALAPVYVLNADMLLMKLHPRNQRSFRAEIKASMGDAREHSKFHDVLNCWFRPAPTIRMTRPVVGPEARVLIHMCPEGVFGFPPDAPSVLHPAHALDHSTPDDDAQDAMDRLETDTFYMAYQNERTYSVMNTLVPVLRTQTTAPPESSPVGKVLQVVQPHRCTLCGACTNPHVNDIEDVVHPILPVEIFVSPSAFIFFLRCRAKKTAHRMLSETLASLASTDTVFARLAHLIAHIG